MKVLLDEQLSPRIARLLCERGKDAQTVAERADLTEASDREVMEAARLEQRAVVTNNVKDFRPIAAERLTDGRGHAGLILLPSSRARSRDSTGALADAIDAVMEAHPEGIADAEHWTQPTS